MKGECARSGDESGREVVGMKTGARDEQVGVERRVGQSGAQWRQRRRRRRRSGECKEVDDELEVK